MSALFMVRICSWPPEESNGIHMRWDTIVIIGSAILVLGVLAAIGVITAGAITFAYSH
jgi:hypothetical protein